MRKTSKLMLFPILSAILYIAPSYEVFCQEEVVCDKTDIEVTENVVGGAFHYVSGESIVANNEIYDQSDVRYTAATSIKLTEGFKVECNSRFKGVIDKKEVVEQLKSSDDASLKEESTERLFNVYPNVSSGIFYINYKNAESTELRINVYNSSGVLTHSKTMFETGAMEIDLSSVPKGIYILKAQAGDESFQKKLILN